MTDDELAGFLAAAEAVIKRNADRAEANTAAKLGDQANVKALH